MSHFNFPRDLRESRGKLAYVVSPSGREGISRSNTSVATAKLCISLVLDGFRVQCVSDRPAPACAQAGITLRRLTWSHYPRLTVSNIEKSFRATGASTLVYLIGESALVNGQVGLRLGDHDAVLTSHHLRSFILSSSCRNFLVVADFAESDAWLGDDGDLVELFGVYDNFDNDALAQLWQPSVELLCAPGKPLTSSYQHGTLLVGALCPRVWGHAAVFGDRSVDNFNAEMECATLLHLQLSIELAMQDDAASIGHFADVTAMIGRFPMPADFNNAGAYLLCFAAYEDAMLVEPPPMVDARDDELIYLAGQETIELPRNVGHAANDPSEAAFLHALNSIVAVIVERDQRDMWSIASVASSSGAEERSFCSFRVIRETTIECILGDLTKIKLAARNGRQRDKRKYELMEDLLSLLPFVSSTSDEGVAHDLLVCSMPSHRHHAPLHDNMRLRALEYLADHDLIEWLPGSRLVAFRVAPRVLSCICDVFGVTQSWVRVMSMLDYAAVQLTAQPMNETLARHAKEVMKWALCALGLTNLDDRVNRGPYVVARDCHCEALTALAHSLCDWCYTHERTTVSLNMLQTIGEAALQFSSNYWETCKEAKLQRINVLTILGAGEAEAIREMVSHGDHSDGNTVAQLERDAVKHLDEATIIISGLRSNECIVPLSRIGGAYPKLPHRESTYLEAFTRFTHFSHSFPPTPLSPAPSPPPTVIRPNNTLDSACVCIDFMAHHSVESYD